jgi:hypothetical protein
MWIPDVIRDLKISEKIEAEHITLSPEQTGRSQKLLPLYSPVKYFSQFKSERFTS